MSCEIKNIRPIMEGVDSKLGESLLEIYNGNLEEAKLTYDKLASSDFTSKFGDWVNEDNIANTNDQGEPLLITDTKLDGSKHHYFILKNGNQFDVIPREFSSFSSYDLTNEIKEITEQLVQYIYSKNFNSDFNSLDGAELNINKDIIDFVEERKAPITEYINSEELDSSEIEELNDAIEYLDNIALHASEFKSEIIKFFNERKLIINDTKIEDKSQQNLENGLQGGDLLQSIEKNSKDNVTANVKLMLSFLPKVDNLTGEPIVGDYLGEQLFQSFDAVYTELQNELVDITTLYLEGSVSDVYKSMTSRISELAKAKKSYHTLLEMLDNLDENKRTEFVQAFYLSKVNFYTSTISGTGKDFRFKVQNISSVAGPIDIKLRNYYVNFKNLFVNKGVVNKGKLKKIKKTVNDILVDVRKDNKIAKLTSQDEFMEQFSEDATKLINVFEELGVDSLTGEAFELFLKQLNFENSDNSYKLMYNKLTGTLLNLDQLLGKLISGEIKGQNDNPFKEYSGYIFNSLAEAENYFDETMGENSVFSGGKTYFTMVNPSYISNRVNHFKQTPEVLRQSRESDYSKDSLWADHLLGEEKTADGDYIISKTSRDNISKSRLENLDIGTFNSLQEENKSAQGTDNKDISYVDQLIDNMNKVLMGSLKGKSSIYTTSTPADKASLHEIKIDFFIEDTTHSMDAAGNIQFSDEVLDIFANYFETEIDRMRKAYAEINELPDDKLSVHYHVNKNGEKYKTLTLPDGSTQDVLIGNAFKSSHILTELSPENIGADLNKALKLYKSDYSPLNPDLVGLTSEQRNIVKGEINKILNDTVKKDYDELLRLRIFEANPNGTVKTNGLDTEIVQQHRTGGSVISFQSSMNMTSDYVINSIIANVEYTKLFTGDPAYYKNMVDFFKRVPSTYTDGINLRLMEGDSSKFDIAVLENIEVESSYIDEIKESLSTTDLSKEEQDYIIEAYSNVNQTDAQGWITPERWAFLMSRTGKWNDTYQSAYNKIKKGLTLSADELKSVAQPVKGVYFGLVNNVPTYLKYSQAVLIPQLVEGTQLARLADKMNQQGISESVVLDGIKVGATVPNKWTDENGDIKIGKLNTISLNNAEWKLQQDLPTKTIKPTLLGSQIQKNILKSILEDAVYTLSDEVIEGNSMLREINKTLSALSNEGINRLSKDIGRTPDGIINKRDLYELLERELLDRGTATNLLRAVQKNLPIEAIPGVKDRLYNILFSKVRSSAVKIKTNGGSFIQMSNFGLDKFTGDQIGVTWLVEPNALKPPLIEKDADGKSHIAPGQILISHSQIAKYLPNYKELAKKGQLKDKLDERLLRAIGYRIPNQGMSSNDPLQIVGILPEGMGDTIVAYTEIPTKTGSDFDIDKMYVMLPNPKVDYGEKLIPTLKKAGITRELGTRLLEKFGFELSKSDKRNADVLLFEYLQNQIDNDIPLPEDLKQLVGAIDQLTATKLEYLEFDKKVSIYENSSKQMQNRLFELYWSILTNEKTYGNLITPIDFPHIQNKIKELHGDNSKQTGELFKFNDPLYQLRLKFTYGAGKAGVGITANHLVDHNRSRFFNMSFNKYYLGRGHQNENESTIFDMEYSETLNGTRYKISDTISAFLNAFVDNAKDPYINDGNFNTYTSSVAFMMIRAGIHPDYIVAFMGQPILKRLVEFTNEYESKSIKKINPELSSFDLIVDELIKQVSKETSDKVVFDKIKTKLSNFSYKKLVDNIRLNRSGNISDSVDKFSDLQILKLFKEFQGQAKKLNDSVQLSRFDTDGAGRNIIDLIILKNKLFELNAKQWDTRELYGHFKKYYNSELGGITSLGTQVENTLVYLDEILDSNPTLFLLGSSPVRDTLNDISSKLIDSRGESRGYLKNENLGKLMMNEMYKYIMSDFPAFKVEGSPLEYIKETSKLISDYKIKDKEFEEGNFFIENIALYDNAFGVINKNKSIEFQDKLYRSARDLMEEDPQLADRIFISSFLMNGFENKIIDMKEFIPYEWFIDNGIRDFIVNKHIQMNNNPTSLNGFRDQFIKNNTVSNILAPKIPVEMVHAIPGIKNKSMGFELTAGLKNNIHDRYLLGHTRDEKPVFVEYLKLGDNLFRLYSYYENTATYLPSQQLGFEDKSSYLNLKEYFFNENKRSNFQTQSDHFKKSLRMLNWAREHLIEENGYDFQRVAFNPLYDVVKGMTYNDVIREGANDSSTNEENDFTNDNCNG